MDLISRSLLRFFVEGIAPSLPLYVADVWKRRSVSL